MIADTICAASGLSLSEVQRLLTLPPRRLINDPVFQEAIQSLDVGILTETLDDARDALDGGIALIKEAAVLKYYLEDFPLNGFMFTNWVIGFLKQTEQLDALTYIHYSIPPYIVHEVTPLILDLYAGMEKGAEDWKRAFALVVLPMDSTHRE